MIKMHEKGRWLRGLIPAFGLISSFVGPVQPVNAIPSTPTVLTIPTQQPQQESLIEKIQKIPPDTISYVGLGLCALFLATSFGIRLINQRFNEPFKRRKK